MKTSEWLVIILLVINVGLLSFFYFHDYRNPLTQCLNDPLVYGYKQLQEVNEYPLTCSCKIASPTPLPQLIFDSSGRRFEEYGIRQVSNSAEYNLSSLFPN